MNALRSLLLVFIFHRIHAAAVVLAVHAVFFAELQAAFEAAFFFEIGEKPFWRFCGRLGDFGACKLSTLYLCTKFVDFYGILERTYRKRSAEIIKIICGSVVVSTLQAELITAAAA